MTMTLRVFFLLLSLYCHDIMGTFVEWFTFTFFMVFEVNVFFLDWLPVKAKEPRLLYLTQSLGKKKRINAFQRALVQK